MRDDRARRSGTSCGCTGLTPDAFVAGVGTGGTVMGVGRYLRTQEPGGPRVPARAGGVADHQHGPQGGAAPHPGHLRRVHPGARQARTSSSRSSRPPTAIRSSWRRSWRSVGLAVGISSGANIIGALKVQDAHRRGRRRGDGASATATRSTSARTCMRTETVKPGYLAPDVGGAGLRRDEARVRALLRRPGVLRARQSRMRTDAGVSDGGSAPVLERRR